MQTFDRLFYTQVVAVPAIAVLVYACWKGMVSVFIGYRSGTLKHILDHSNRVGDGLLLQSIFVFTVVSLYNPLLRLALALYDCREVGGAPLFHRHLPVRCDDPRHRAAQGLAAGVLVARPCVKCASSFACDNCAIADVRTAVFLLPPYGPPFLVIFSQAACVVLPVASGIYLHRTASTAEAQRKNRALRYRPSQFRGNT